MKKLSILFTVLMIVFSITACNNDIETEETTENLENNEQIVEETVEETVEEVPNVGEIDDIIENNEYSLQNAKAIYEILTVQEQVSDEDMVKFLNFCDMTFRTVYPDGTETDIVPFTLYQSEGSNYFDTDFLLIENTIKTTETMSEYLKLLGNYGTRHLVHDAAVTNWFLYGEAVVYFNEFSQTYPDFIESEKINTTAKNLLSIYIGEIPMDNTLVIDIDTLNVDTFASYEYVIDNFEGYKVHEDIKKLYDVWKTFERLYTEDVKSVILEISVKYNLGN